MAGHRTAADRAEAIRKRRGRYEGSLAQHEAALVPLIEAVRAAAALDPRALYRLVRIHKSPTGSFSKSDLIRAFRELSPGRGWSDEEAFVEKLRAKPMRTRSGVAPVTVLTKPYPCPGRCVFCPSDVRMPRSYLSQEPGAQRAAQNRFDPYLQTWNRLRALDHNGHPLDKIELIILGGTWSSYPERYQVWFVKRCFEALEDYPRRDLAPPEGAGLDFLDLEESIDGRKATRTYNEVVAEHLRHRLDGELLDRSETAAWEGLESVQRRNERGAQRCVGLVVETRPDQVSAAEVARIRRLGGTKVQLGLQSASDAVLEQNARGHDVEASRRAIGLLRGAAFKIHGHWMPNLHGSTPAEDVADFDRLWSDPRLRPDELKIYPVSLIASSELMVHHEAGRFRPYTGEELLEVLVQCLARTPRWCRITRVIRDIPAHDIVAGNRRSNLRELAERAALARGLRLEDMRFRQIRRAAPPPCDLELRVTPYAAGSGQERFLELVTGRDELVGFLRLFLPDGEPSLPSLQGAALIREVHVYGAVAALGQHDPGKSQHGGVGRTLVARAEEIAAEHGHGKIAVISAVGTREYYRSLGYRDGELYLFKEIAARPTAARSVPS